MEFTIWDWTVALWQDGWKLWILGILCWAVVLTIRIHDSYVAKRRKDKGQITRKVYIPVRYEETSDQDYQLVVSKGKSVERLQPVHQDARRDSYDWWYRRLHLLYMRSHQEASGDSR